MSRSRRRFAAVLTGAALVLAACGGDDLSSSEAANADLERQLAELEAQIAELEGGSESPAADDGASTDGGSTDGGVTTLEDVPAPLEISDDGLYGTPEDAERAAEAIGCDGAHPMGDQYMPCGEHGQLDEIEAEVEQAPPAEEAPIEDATVYAPPADAAPAAPTTDAAAPIAPADIEYSIDQSRTNPSRFSIMVEASAPDLRTNTLGIKAVCLYQYNEYDTSVHGDPKRPCSRSNGLLASYLPYAKSWSVLGQCGSNGQIKDYYDIGIVAEDGRSVVVRVKDSPC